MKVPEDVLERTEAQAIVAANQIIEAWGEVEGARILRILHGVYDRKILDCEKMAEMRRAHEKLSSAQSVPTKPRFFLIQGGA